MLDYNCLALCQSRLNFASVVSFTSHPCTHKENISSSLSLTFFWIKNNETRDHSKKKNMQKLKKRIVAQMCLWWFLSLLAVLNSLNPIQHLFKLFKRHSRKAQVEIIKLTIVRFFLTWDKKKIKEERDGSCLIFPHINSSTSMRSYIITRFISGEKAPPLDICGS